MKRLVAIGFTLAAFLAAEAAIAQAGGGRGSGSTNMGRGRTTWITDTEIATEALKTFEAELEAMELETWKESSVAWIEFEFDEKAGRISLPSTFHIQEVEADRRAEVEQGGAEWEPSFQIAFPRKPPKELQLKLTDINSTQVTCPLAEAVKKERGLFGVFVHDNGLHCLFRERSDEDEDTTPA